ncbi:MAG: steroid 3-ketoacyl-CoA thiolase [Acidimicrobiales bacterium]
MEREVVLVEAVRTPTGKKKGSLANVHSADLLGVVQTAVIERSGIDPAQVDQVVAGCISQSGAQSFNIGRTAWLAAGLPLSVPATTVDSQCGSSQQASSIAASLIASGAIDVAVACGVENLNLVPINAATKAGPGRALTKSYFARYEFISQFEAGERIAKKWGISREECDALGLSSQVRAARAWSEGRYDAEVIPTAFPVWDDEGKPTADFGLLERDETMRQTSMEALAALKPLSGQPDGYHTAGTSSQLGDQSSAVLMMSRARADELGLRARARLVDHCLVGVDPTLMLTGPIDATERLLKRNGLSIADIDVFEINEAFASVVLAWSREVSPDMERVNPNGGAIALGHALGSTGTRLITTALHELERSDSEIALVSMCCGGGLGTGTLLQRIDS